MILVDWGQIFYATMFGHLAHTKQTEPDVAMIRHLMLNSLRSTVKRFKATYGEVVVICDDTNYWRKDVFQHYKAHRKSDRDKSPFNWVAVFNCMDTLRGEIQQHLMYKVLQVPRAEADDIIGVLAPLVAAEQSVMIVSGDKDFIQCQAYPNVRQYSPQLEKQLVEQNPMSILKEHVIRGDSGDGIPNILSADDVFVSGGRQTPIQSKKVAVWLTQTPEEFCTSGDMLRNYRRNEMLIDLRQIPTHMKVEIVQAYESATRASRSQFLTYLMVSGLRELTRSIEDF
jgi:hypothetical protein